MGALRVMAASLTSALRAAEELRLEAVYLRRIIREHRDARTFAPDGIDPTPADHALWSAAGCSTVRAAGLNGEAPG